MIAHRPTLRRWALAAVAALLFSAGVARAEGDPPPVPPATASDDAPTPPIPWLSKNLEEALKHFEANPGTDEFAAILRLLPRNGAEDAADTVYYVEDDMPLTIRDVCAWVTRITQKLPPEAACPQDKPEAPKPREFQPQLRTYNCYDPSVGNAVVTCIWPRRLRDRLKFVVDEFSFLGHDTLPPRVSDATYKEFITELGGAVDAWNAACRTCGLKMSVSIKRQENLEPTLTTFIVRHDEDICAANTWGCSFFRTTPTAKKVFRLTRKFFRAKGLNAPNWRVQWRHTLRHELGHVLGYGHEQYAGLSSLSSCKKDIDDTFKPDDPASGGAATVDESSPQEPSVMFSSICWSPSVNRPPPEMTGGLTPQDIRVHQRTHPPRHSCASGNL